MATQVRPCGQELSRRRVEQHPEANDPTSLDLRRVGAGDRDRTVLRPGVPAQHGEAVMANGRSIGHKREIRTELSQQLASDVRDVAAALHDAGRLVHHGIGYEQFGDDSVTPSRIALVENAFEIVAKQSVVVRHGLYRCHGGSLDAQR